MSSIATVLGIIVNSMAHNNIETSSFMVTATSASNSISYRLFISVSVNKL